MKHRVIGNKVADVRIVENRGHDDFWGTSPHLDRYLVAFGASDDLFSEWMALSELRPFAKPAERGFDPNWGSFLRTPIDSDIVPLTRIGFQPTLEQAVSILDEALTIAGRLESVSLRWEPLASDLYWSEGALYPIRMRARPLAKTERTDARSVLATVAAPFLPAPLLKGPQRLARLLAPCAGRVLTVDRARDELTEVFDEIAISSHVRPKVAGMSDRGMRRLTNEDSFAVATGHAIEGPWSVLVICDGVSSSVAAEQASSIAARTIRDGLVAALSGGARSASDMEEAMKRSIVAAHEAICSRAARDARVPSGTTAVAVATSGNRLTVGWVGDSRAYFLGEQTADLLTRDHAIAGADASSELTRCIGPLARSGPHDASTVMIPEIAHRSLNEPGHIVVCSDGFWSYFPRGDQIGTLVREMGEAPSMPSIAGWLVNHALMRGGHDNIAIAIAMHGARKS